MCSIPPRLLRDWSCSRCKNIDITDVEVAEILADKLLAFTGVLHEHKVIVLTIRGTIDGDIVNWLLNFQFWQQPCNFTRAYEDKKAKLHHGFYQAYEKLRHGVTQILSDTFEKHPDYRLVLTGHSLGGSIATIFAAEFLSSKFIKEYQNMILYTMGEPRTGNHAFMQVFEESVKFRQGSTYRVVSKKDIVPHIPFRDMLGEEYWHISTEAWILPQTGLELKICDGSGEDGTCSDSLPFSALSVNDHVSYFNQNLGPCAH
eukprot:m.36574 g.36574  ORF g.36574 m.36574 type:complete len:259 (+) comp9146_c0_seq1:237-1013(+)